MEGVRYEHRIEKSRFNVGAGGHHKAEGPYKHIVGDKGAFMVDTVTGATLAVPHAPVVPKLCLAATASRPRTPPPTARCNLTLGWTDRPPMRPDLVCADARYGGYAGGPPCPFVCDRPWQPPRHGVARVPGVSSVLSVPPGPHGVPTRQAPGTPPPWQAVSCGAGFMPHAPSLPGAGGHPRAG
jgi:hypothetical protein